MGLRAKRVDVGDATARMAESATARIFNRIGRGRSEGLGESLPVLLEDGARRRVREQPASIDQLD